MESIELNSKGAVEDYTKAIELNPEYPDAYRSRGLIKQALGDSEGAEEDFATASELLAEKKQTSAFRKR